MLLHGQPGGARDWDAVRVALGEGTHTVAIDRPGWDGASAAAGLAENAGATLDALDALGGGRATLVGHSFGAAVAAWVAAQHPDRVGALVLLAPAANGASLFAVDRWLALPVAGDLASASLLASAGLMLALTQARRWIAGQLALDERFLRDVGQAMRSPAAWRAFAVEQRALLRELPLLEEMLPRIGAPTKVVIGTADRVVPPNSARKLATQIAGAELIEIAHASHLLPLQHPERIAELIAAATAR